MKTASIHIISLVLATFLAQSCSEYHQRIEGNGSIITTELDIDPFTAIRLEGADNAEIRYGDQQKVVVRGHSNIISRIRTDVHNGTWVMGLENGNYGNYELSYSLTLPRLEGVELIGSGNVSVDTPLSAPDFDLYLMGSGNFNGFEVLTSRCQVEIVGSGNAEISVESKLEVIIEGSGNLSYLGNPVIHQDITGSGNVINAN